jgi:methylthioribulose-1-phosphate dehydratase
MAATFDQYSPSRALTMIARDFHARGWMMGTAGNLSARVMNGDAGSFWITASGQPKGQLNEDDLLRVAIHDDTVLESPTPGHRPSAETSIHRVIYQLFPQARAVFHTHTVEACLAAEQAHPGAETLRLPPLEMLKGFDLWEQDPRVDLPVFDNQLDVRKMAQQIMERFTKNPPRIPALLIHAHGVTVWGHSLQQAYHHAELMEFILRYMALRGRTTT